jgi:O-antigen ligase
MQLIPNSIKGLPVILLFIVVLFSNIKKTTNWKWLLINSSLFLLYLFSLAYTANFNIALRKLETGLSILIIPIIFYGFLAQYSFEQSLKTKFFKIFILASFCFSVICLAFISIDNSTIYYSDWYTDKFRSIIIEIPLIGQHPIYASIFLSLSVLFYTELIKIYSFKIKYRNIYIVFILTNIVLLLMLASKGVILSLFLVSFVDAIRKKKNFKIVVVIIFITISFLAFNRRVKEIFKAETYTEINENFSTSIRIGIYKCALKVISKELILGYGIGDSQEALNLCYANESNVLLKNRYNSHNQYLDIIIKTGIFGLLFFILFIYWNFNKAIKNRNRLVVSILGFYFILFFTENILVRQSGVILFFFLITFLNHKTNTIEIKSNENSRFKPVQNT